MAKLKTPESVMAFEYLCQHIRKTRQAPKPYHREFLSRLDTLIRAVQNETELALMRGETRVLGEKHMLITCIYEALSLCCRPVHREAAFTIVKEALGRYLGVAFPDPPPKRPRRKLLPHV